MRKMDEEKARRIVSALLNDAGRTPEEAAAAAQKAAEIMLEHGLTPEDLEDPKAQVGVTRSEATRHEWLLVKFLMVPVADMTGCRAWYGDIWTPRGGRTDRKAYNFAGYGPDVENAVWLMGTLLRAAKDGARAFGFSKDPERSSYLVGFAAEAQKRIMAVVESMDRAQNALPSAMALVESKAGAIDEHLKGLGLKLGRSRTSGSHVGGDAGEAGREAGRHVALGRPVGGCGRVLALESPI